MLTTCEQHGRLVPIHLAVTVRLFPCGTPRPRAELSNGTLLVRYHRVHMRLRQAKRISPRPHHYGEATAKRCHSPGTPLSS
jgi:hypothetical protein